MKQRLIVLVLAALFAAGSAQAQIAASAEQAPMPAAQPTAQAAAQAAQVAAKQSIEEFHGALLEALRSAAPVAGRAEIIAPAVRAHFNVATIARLTLGSTWRSLDRPERERFQLALRDLISATYADRFAEDNGQSFEILAVSTGPRGPVVRTRLIRQSGAPVSLDYHFRGGQIYNVVADGVSDLSLRRADYNSIIKQKGYQALVAHIAEQLQKLTGQPQQESTDEKS